VCNGKISITCKYLDVKNDEIINVLENCHLLVALSKYSAKLMFFFNIRKNNEKTTMRKFCLIKTYYFISVFNIFVVVLLQFRKMRLIPMNKIAIFTIALGIVRMSADDIMLPNRLAVQYEFMEEHPEIDVCSSETQVTGTRQEEMVLARLNTHEYELLIGQENILYRERLNNIVINEFEFLESSLDWFILKKGNDSVTSITNILLYNRK
jgi:hypothetical protein